MVEGIKEICAELQPRTLSMREVLTERDICSCQARRDNGIAPAIAPGTFGNCRRNPIVAPGLTTADISLGKNFPHREGARLEFRADFFNAFNHPNFGEPGPFLGGTITGTADDSSFDSHFGAGGPRNIQLGLRLRW